MKNKIHMWGENIIPTFVSIFEEEEISTSDQRTNEFMQHFDALVRKYPFIKEDKRESVYIWLIITKMGTIEGWDNFKGNPKLFTDEVEKRILRLFPNIKK